jgi:hypothetical protein
MSVGSRGPAVIDTGVFGARLTPSGRLLASRWVAATAVWLQIPLVAHDAIFTNVKDLDLVARLGQ